MAIGSHVARRLAPMFVIGVAWVAPLAAQLNPPPKLSALNRSLVVQGGEGRVDQARLFSVVDRLLTDAGFASDNEHALLIVGVGLSRASETHVVVSVSVRLDESVDRIGVSNDEPITAATWQRGEVRVYTAASLALEVERAVIFWVNTFLGDYRMAHGR